MDTPLFPADDSPETPSPAKGAQEASRGQPRLRLPIRNQVEMQWASLDDLLDPDHTVRIVWDAVEGLDLGDWLAEIKAVRGHVGRNATDPRLLLALWVYATLKGVGSARELDRLCREHIAYKWLRGGVSVNYHMLADFRSGEGQKWDDLLTEIVATLLKEDLVKMDRVAQDGMKVRANAGKGSFRRERSLQECLAEAKEQVETLKQLAKENPDELTRRQKGAQQRAAEERRGRIEGALVQRRELQEQREATADKSGRKVTEARASTTDPEARTVKFSDGGYRPGYNVQFATDTSSGVIVGVAVTNAGTDSEQLTPMLEQLKGRYGCYPKEAAVDGGFATLEAIEEATARGCTVYAPLKDEKKQLAAGKDPYARKRGDSEAVAEWRIRMGTAAAKLIYGLRCQTAEWVNAQCRNRGLQQMPVRGRGKCQIIGLLYAITHNLLLGERLRAGAVEGVV